MHGQHGQHYLNKDEPNSCFVDISALFQTGMENALAAFTSSPVIKDTRVGNSFDHQGLRFNFSSTSTAVRIASYATFTWYKNTTLYVDYI